MSVEIVCKPPKPASKKVMLVWAKEWHKEGKKVYWEKLMPLRGYVAFLAGGWWSVPSGICHNRRISKDYERLCATGEAFVYAAMTRLMVRRLARA